MNKRVSRDKFVYSIEFQWEILRFTVSHREGYKVVSLYKYSYFDTLDQQVIARAIQKFYRLKNRIPNNSAILNEELRRMFRTKDYINTILKKDQERIYKRVKLLYKPKSMDAAEVIEKCKTFASYVEFKKILENIDITDFNKYESYSKAIQKAVNLGMAIDERKGSFMVSAARTRIAERNSREAVISTPFKQLNSLTNAQGYTKGSIITIIDKPKGGKTTMLVNFAVQYAKKFRRKVIAGEKKTRKKVIYFDLENGEENISTRIDQCILNKSKLEILSGEYDNHLKKAYRILKRMGSEIFVIRLSARSTTNDLQKVLDEIYDEYGILFEVAIIDYIGLMGCLSGKTDDEPRISEAYIDVKNWAKKNDLDIVITGHHVKREGYKRRGTRYQSDDIAKCLEIVRHVDALFGYNQSAKEEAAGIARLELIDQRDGVQSGRVYFNVNLNTQRLIEFTDKQLTAIKEIKKEKPKGDL